VAGCCECGDEPLGSCATELVSLEFIIIIIIIIIIVERRGRVANTPASYSGSVGFKSRLGDRLF
jgi:hypothetical protein